MKYLHLTSLTSQSTVNLHTTSFFVTFPFQSEFPSCDSTESSGNKTELNRNQNVGDKSAAYSEYSNCCVSHAIFAIVVKHSRLIILFGCMHFSAVMCVF